MATLVSLTLSPLHAQYYVDKWQIQQCFFVSARYIGSVALHKVLGSGGARRTQFCLRRLHSADSWGEVRRQRPLRQAIAQRRGPGVTECAVATAGEKEFAILVRMGRFNSEVLRRLKDSNFIRQRSVHVKKNICL